MTANEITTPSTHGAECSACNDDGDRSPITAFAKTVVAEFISASP